MSTLISSQPTARHWAEVALTWLAQVIIARGLKSLDDGTLADLGVTRDDIKTLGVGTTSAPKTKTQGQNTWLI